MVGKILFWSGFGCAVRFWQLGIEMRPFLTARTAWAYPVYGALGAAFGYYLTGVEDRQMRYLHETRDRLLEKRRRRAEREGNTIGNIGSEFQHEQEGLFASPKVVVEKGEHIPDGTVERTQAAQ